VKDYSKGGTYKDNPDEVIVNNFRTMTKKKIQNKLMQSYQQFEQSAERNNSRELKSQDFSTYGFNKSKRSYMNDILGPLVNSVTNKMMQNNSFEKFKDQKLNHLNEIENKDTMFKVSTHNKPRDENLPVISFILF
jgi:hypothetical protein